MITDSHCHLGQYLNATQVMERARTAGVSIVAATESPDEYRRLRSRVGPRAGVIIGLGLHPSSHAIRLPGQLNRFFRLLPDAVWVSEIGLDYAEASASDRRNQNAMLDAILEHGLMQTKLVSMHSRRAATDVVAKLGGLGNQVVLHWFSGGIAVAERAADLGVRFSFNMPMLQSEKGLALLAAVPQHQVLLETDGPFASRSRTPSEPADLLAAIPTIANVWKVEIEEAHRKLVANFDAFTGPATSGHPPLLRSPHEVEGTPVVRPLLGGGRGWCGR